MDLVGERDQKVGDRLSLDVRQHLALAQPVGRVQGCLQQRRVVVGLSVEPGVLDEGRHDGVANVTIQGKAHL